METNPESSRIVIRKRGKSRQESWSGSPARRADRMGGKAIGGGVITYTGNGAQNVVVAAGFTHFAWPTKIVTAKILILGLDGASGSP